MIDDYAGGHNDLAGDATSHLSAHLHFGSISATDLVIKIGSEPAGEAFIREVAWRDFTHQLLAARPDAAYRDYRHRGLPWRSASEDLLRWQTGRTGYPIVDAGMRQLLREGWMHNRARLIVASFLTKTLLIDWCYGARYFWTTSSTPTSPTTRSSGSGSRAPAPAPIRCLTRCAKPRSTTRWRLRAVVRARARPPYRARYPPTAHAVTAATGRPGIFGRMVELGVGRARFLAAFRAAAALTAPRQRSLLLCPRQFRAVSTGAVVMRRPNWLSAQPTRPPSTALPGPASGTRPYCKSQAATWWSYVR